MGYTTVPEAADLTPLQIEAVRYGSRDNFLDNQLPIFFLNVLDDEKPIYSSFCLVRVDDTAMETLCYLSVSGHYVNLPSLTNLPC